MRWCCCGVVVIGCCGLRVWLCCSECFVFWGGVWYHSVALLGGALEHLDSNALGLFGGKESYKAVGLWS